MVNTVNITKRFIKQPPSFKDVFVDCSWLKIGRSSEGQQHYMSRDCAILDGSCRNSL
jgi:hypothetical protein